MRGLIRLLVFLLILAGLAGVGLYFKERQGEDTVIAMSNSLVWDWLATPVPPSFESSSVTQDETAGRWVVTGDVSYQTAEHTVVRQPYTAVLETTCSDRSVRVCWGLVSLTVRGEEIPQNGTASADPLTLAPISEAAVNPTAASSAPQAPAASDEPAAPPRAAGGSESSGVAAVEQTVALTLKDADQATQAAPSGQELVRRIQAALRDLGLNPGPADGVIGPRTREAISSFQERRGLPINGEPSVELLQAMEAQL